MKKLITSVALGTLLSTTAMAAELQVDIEIPSLDVAEYHKPYLAIWIEDGSNKTAANLAVLYDTKLKNKEGEDWLKDMRQWWRKSGRSLTMPVDGVSGATKGPGTHQFSFVAGQSVLPELAAGEYKLRVEAAREVGGREIINIPFTWPVTEAQTFVVEGENELGKIGLTLKP